MPERIQLRRTKGWRKPEGAVNVARPTRWGNWYAVRPNRIPAGPPGSGRIKRAGPLWTIVHLSKHGHEDGPMWGAFTNEAEATEFAILLFRRSLEASFADVDGDLNREFYLRDLTGHDLGCYCPLDRPCHADVLLELANP